MEAKELKHIAEQIMSLSYLAEQGVMIGDKISAGKNEEGLYLHYSFAPVFQGKILNIDKSIKF